MQHYKFKGDNQTLHVIFYKEDIVRMIYTKDSKIPKSSPGVIIQPEEVVTKKEKNILSSEILDVKVDDYLRVEIYDKAGNLLNRDSHTIKKDIKNNQEKYTANMNYFKEEEEKSEIILEKDLLFETGFYGMGEKYNYINFLENETTHWCTDVLGVSPIHTAAQQEYHTAIPFYVGMNTELSYGIFYDNTYRTQFNFAKNSDKIVFKADGGSIDYYFMYGNKVGEVLQKYTQITGKMPLPRRSFLGYQQCRWSYNTKDMLMETAKKMYEEKIPCDVFYLDIDYMDDYKVFTIDSNEFKDFKKMVDELKSMGYKLVTIIDPGVKKEKGYDVYDEGIQKDYFVKNKKGKVYVGEVWPGDSVFPDFMREEVRKWWGELHEILIDNGVSGIWNDMNEPADMCTETKTLPESCYHIDDQGKKRYQKEIHNLYAHLECEATYRGLLALQPDKRPFVLTRAAYAGTQRYSAIWTGDNASIWEHIEATIPMVMNLNLSGFSFCGPDVGGFLENATGELLIRFTQLGAFMPLFRNHCALNFRRQEPWQFDEKTLAYTKEMIELRYTLIPYLYNMMYQNSVEGIPAIRPLFFDDQEDQNTHNISDQFMFGESMMICPITKPKADHRMIYLPEGRWYNFWTDEKIQGGKHIVVKAPLNQIPILIKEGAIIPRQKVSRHLDGDISELDLHIYTGKESSYEFYWDDGESFDYKNNGSFNKYKFNIKANKVVKKVLKEDYKEMQFNYIYH